MEFQTNVSVFNWAPENDKCGKGDGLNWPLRYKLKILTSKDFIVQCPKSSKTGADEVKSVHTHKSLLHARSKYFAIMFNMDSTVSSTYLDFDYRLVKTTLRGLKKSPNFSKFDIDDLLKLLKLADFLQIGILISPLINCIEAKVNCKSFVSVVHFWWSHIDNPTFLDLNSICCKFMKENFVQLKNQLSSFPLEWLRKLGDAPPMYIRNEEGRRVYAFGSQLQLVAGVYDSRLIEVSVPDITRFMMFLSLTSPDSDHLGLSDTARNRIWVTYKLVEFENLLQRPPAHVTSLHKKREIVVPVSNLESRISARRKRMKGVFNYVGMKLAMVNRSDIIKGFGAETLEEETPLLE